MEALGLDQKKEDKYHIIICKEHLGHTTDEEEEDYR